MNIYGYYKENGVLKYRLLTDKVLEFYKKKRKRLKNKARQCIVNKTKKAI